MLFGFLRIVPGVGAFAWSILAMSEFVCSLSAKDVTSAWFAEGKFFEESASQRMTNGFGRRLDFTDDPNFLINWQTNWNSISSIKRLERVYIVLFVADNSGAQAPTAVYDLTIKMPNGSVCAHFTNQPVLKPILNPVLSHADLKPALRLNPHFTIFYTDPPDPIGPYVVEVELRDRLRKTSLKLSKQLNVTQ